MTDETRMVNQTRANKVDSLKEEMIAQVPAHLWSQHETYVGLVKTANPVQIGLKRQAKLPRKSQYPLKQEAEAGIASTITGLVHAGVLTPTKSGVRVRHATLQYFLC